MKGLLKAVLATAVMALLLQGGSVLAQGTWSFVAQPDLDYSIADVFFLDDGQTGWFVGDDGLILKTTDGGVTHEPQEAGTTEDLNRVVFINDSTGWIVGENGTILKTTNAGMVWMVQTPVDATHDYNDITVATETHAIAVGDKGIIVATTDGETWVSQTSNTTENLYGVSSFGMNVAIAVGAHETILHTTDGGMTWLAASTIAPIQGKDYNAVKVVSEKKAWLIGDGFAFLGLKSVFAWTEDGGDNWTLYLPTEEAYGNMWDIDFYDSTTGIAVGDDGLVFTTSDGVDWVQAPVGFGIGARTVSLVADKAWACRYETILRTEDFAQTWELLVKITGHNQYDLCRLSESHFMAVGYNSSKLESKDGGYTWQSGYIVADNHVGHIWGIHFINPDTGWVVGSGSFVAKTEDAGETWRYLETPLVNVWFREAFFVNDTTGWIVGKDGGAGPSRVLKTTDGGESWTEQTGLPIETLYSIFMLDENSGVIGGGDNTLYYTTDGGANWNLATFNIDGEKDINGLFFLDAAHGWAVGEKGLILFTDDGGVTWTDQSYTTTTELEDVYFRNPLEGWAVGDDYLILITSDGGATWTEQFEGGSRDKAMGIIPKHGSILFTAGYNGRVARYVDDSYFTTSNIKMNEIFYNAFKSSELECQFIELYNAGTEVEYLDGKIICRMSRGDINYATYTWQFPGSGTDYPIQPGEYKIVTPDAKTYTDLDLSNADFEFFIEGEFREYDNPDVPNLINIRNLTDPSHHSEFLINFRADVVILASGKDLYWQDGIDIETIIDGVEYDVSAESKMTLNDLVDAGHAIGPSSNYQGKSVERKEPGMDTNNSTNDFRLINAPTPWGTAASYKISGSVSYFSNDKAVAEVDMKLTGVPNVTTQTGMDGQYMFDYLIDSDFVLTGEKVGDLGDAVDPFDATIILQYAVKAGTLTPAQMLAGDVTRNGDVTAFDASYILRKYVGVLTEFPSGKDWTFVPSSFVLDEANWFAAPDFLEYKPLDADYADQNFIAFAYGDVSGNWGETMLAKTSGNANITFGEATKLNNKTISLPISMEQANLVLSGGFKINVDTRQYRIVAIRQGELLEGATFASNIDGSTIAFAFANAFPIQGNGVIATVDLELLKGDPTSTHSLDFSHISLNEGSIKAHVNGQPLIKDASIPDKFSLKQNYPNPFNPATTIAFDLPKDTKVTIKIYDILGQEVATIVDQSLRAGSHTVRYDASDLASGVYFYQIKTKEFASVKKMILLK